MKSQNNKQRSIRARAKKHQDLEFKAERKYRNIKRDSRIACILLHEVTYRCTPMYISCLQDTPKCLPYRDFKTERHGHTKK